MRVPPKVPHPPPPPDLPSLQPSQARAGPAGSAAQSQSPDHSVIDLSVDDDDDLPPLDDADGHEEGAEGKSQPMASEPAETPYELRERRGVNYYPGPQKYRIPGANLAIIEPDDCTLSSIMIYRSRAVPQEEGAPFANHCGGKFNDPAMKPTSVAPPRNRKEALLSPWWQGYYEAELQEMQSHKENKTWELIPREQVPPGMPILPDRWAYDDKLAPGGNVIEKFKARLTAMGRLQKHGKDFTDTYASVMSTRMFRLLLQVYESNQMEHWDVSTAFVHAPLKEKVYMKQASGHGEGQRRLGLPVGEGALRDEAGRPCVAATPEEAVGRGGLYFSHPRPRHLHSTHR